MTMSKTSMILQVNFHILEKKEKIILEETINTKEPFATYIEANIVIQKQLIQFMQIIID